MNRSAILDISTTPNAEPTVQSPKYIRKTGKMTKKVRKELTSKKMTACIQKDANPMPTVPKLSVQAPELAVEQEIEWEVAPDVDRNWRRMVAKSKAEECHRLMHGVKKMVSEIVMDMADRVEAMR